MILRAVTQSQQRQYHQHLTCTPAAGAQTPISPFLSPYYGKIQLRRGNQGELYSSLLLCCRGLEALSPSQAPSEKALENQVQPQTHCAQSQLVCLAQKNLSNQSLPFL